MNELYFVVLTLLVLYVSCDTSAHALYESFTGTGAIICLHHTSGVTLEDMGEIDRGPFLLTWINFNPSIEK